MCVSVGTLVVGPRVMAKTARNTRVAVERQFPDLMTLIALRSPGRRADEGALLQSKPPRPTTDCDPVSKPFMVNCIHVARLVPTATPLELFTETPPPIAWREPADLTPLPQALFPGQPTIHPPGEPYRPPPPPLPYGNPGNPPPPVTPVVVAWFPAVPEPSTWAMMILGFGILGATLRRRRRRLRAEAATATPAT